MKDLPADVLQAVNSRNDARAALKRAQERLNKALTPHVGETFVVDGVPLKVCGAMDRLYLWRPVSRAEAARLHREFVEGMRAS